MKKKLAYGYVICCIKWSALS